MPRSDDHLCPVTDDNIEDFFRTEELYFQMDKHTQEIQMPYPGLPHGDQQGEFIEGEMHELESVRGALTPEEIKERQIAYMTAALMWVGVISIGVLVLAGLARAVGWILGL